MKKILFLAMSIVIALSLSGCGNKDKTGDNSSKQEEKKITNINDAIGKGGKYICTYKDKSGVESKISIDNDKFKTEYSADEKTQISIYDGSFYYYFMEGESKGNKISKTCLDELAVGSETETPANANESEYNREVDAYETEDDFNDASEVNCQAVKTVDLSLPEGVEFTDQCDTLKAAKQLMQSLEGQVNDIFDKAPTQ